MDRMQEPQFGVGKSIVYAAILVTFFLGLAELAVRGWAYYLREDAEKFDLATQTFVLVPGEHRSYTGTEVINSQGFVGRELKPDGPDLWRIAAVGDSCTYGGGHPVYTYSAQLQALLEERERPGRRYEVVNAGVSGLNSELALRRLRSKVLPLDPEVVTIYIGWNDLMKTDPAGGGGSGRWAGLARLIDRLWLVKGLRKMLFFYIRPHVWPPSTGPESRTGRIDGFRPAIFEDNLREMIAAVRGIDSRPVLLTLPTVVRPDMTLREVRDAHVVFPYFPAAYGVLDLLDLVGAYNHSISRVAVEEGVPLVDLTRVFEPMRDRSPYFFDTMHLNRDGARLVAQELLRGLERNGLIGPGEAMEREAR